jgi:hypothetical protein
MIRNLESITGEPHPPQEGQFISLWRKSLYREVKKNLTFGVKEVLIVFLSSVGNFR